MNDKDKMISWRTRVKAHLQCAPCFLFFAFASLRTVFVSVAQDKKRTPQETRNIVNKIVHKNASAKARNRKQRAHCRLGSVGIFLDLSLYS